MVYCWLVYDFPYRKSNSFCVGGQLIPVIIYHENEHWQLNWFAYHIYNRFRYDKSFEWNCMFANRLFSTISLSMRLRMSRCVLFQVYFFFYYYICRDRSWIYNYVCNQHLSPLTLWIRTSLMAMCRLSVTCGRSVVFSGYSGFLHQ